MTRLRHTAWKPVIPFLPSRLAERPLHRPMTGYSSHLERLHHRLHEEQERRCQELEQQGSSSSPQQKVESLRSCSPVPPLEASPAPPLDVPDAGVAAGGDPDDGGDDSSSSHSTDLSEEQSQRDGLLDPSLVMPLAGVTSTMRSTPCCARHLTDVPSLSSIVVLSSSTVAGFTRTAGRRLVWCTIRRTVSRVRRSA
jgi:hypothetical protein